MTEDLVDALLSDESGFDITLEYLKNDIRRFKEMGISCKLFSSANKETYITVNATNLVNWSNRANLVYSNSFIILNILL